MRERTFILSNLMATFLAVVCAAPSFAQPGGILRGTVIVQGADAPMHNATVLIIQLGRAARTDLEGVYVFEQVPPGTYDVVAHMHALTDERRTVQIPPGGTVTLDFELRLSPLRQEITVTASGHEETTFDTFQAVTTLDSLQLSAKNAFALGEVLDNQPGVAKRSFGPGSARPVLRGFDGDRVLILSDGLPTGTLSSQSGEHAEPIDAASLERVEIVKGPATLLYGSNAIGGVVNAVTEHHMLHEHAHTGLRGYVSSGVGSNDNSAGGSVGFEYGVQRWLLWGNGGRQVASDYSSPLGRVEDSNTRLSSGSLGFGWFGSRPFFSAGYAVQDGRFGVPFAGEFHHHDDSAEEGNHAHDHTQVHETFTWQNVRFNTGIRNLNSFLERFRLIGNFSRWIHRELEGQEVATTFDNKSLNYRGTFDQRVNRRLLGSFGFQGVHRSYSAVGEEALAPPVTQNGIAIFTLQEMDLERAKIQFGARFDHTSYDPLGLPPRSFTGFSGAAGVRIGLWNHGALVTNYTRSYRSPALEELYNYGPHIGNLAFEIGNPGLAGEAGDGMDISLRHSSRSVRAQGNFFYYRLRNFVYMALTGETLHGLRVVNFDQADSRFRGVETSLDVALHPNFWINAGMDAVNAKLTQSNTPLPRIPPLRGRIGVDARFRGLSVKPELIMANAQDRIFPTETPTAGYSIVNLDLSYVIPKTHAAHVFSVTAFNLGNTLYRNHLSFIKDLAPEMGRGVRFNYTLRFF